MKTIVRFLCAVALCVYGFCSASAQQQVPEGFPGKWVFVYEDPQTGQEARGRCTVKQDGGDTVAQFELDYGSPTTTAFRYNENGKFYADMEIMGYPILLAFKAAGETLLCEFDGGIFFLSFVMKKEE
jgi:hypothetical protein